MLRARRSLTSNIVGPPLPQRPDHPAMGTGTNRSASPCPFFSRPGASMPRYSGLVRAGPETAPKARNHLGGGRFSCRGRFLRMRSSCRPRVRSRASSSPTVALLKCGTNSRGLLDRTKGAGQCPTERKSPLARPLRYCADPANERRQLRPLRREAPDLDRTCARRGPKVNSDALRRGPRAPRRDARPHPRS